MKNHCIPFSNLSHTDQLLIGGKNASLAEMVKELSHLGIKIPEGFAITTEAYKAFLSENDLWEKLKTELESLDKVAFSNLGNIGNICRDLMKSGRIPEKTKQEIRSAYYSLGGTLPISVAVRSSATAEDLPTASFAGQHDSFLNIKGEEGWLSP